VARAIAFALVLLFWNGPALAQDPPAGFAEQVEVRVMDLDVVVTDRDGKPVRDLKRQDFTVRLGGKVVPIDYFARVDAGAIHAPDLATASPEQVLAAPERAEQVYLPRYFLIYVDLGHMNPVWKRRALEPLRDLVARFGPSDHGRVLMFDRRSTVLTEWTSKKEALLAALSTVDKTVGMSRLTSERQARYSVDHPPGLTPGQRSRYIEFVVSQYAKEARAATLELLRDVESGLAALAPLAGKKSFLFVSGGFDFQPGLALGAYGLGRSGFLTRDSRDVSADLDAIVKRANASEITFYAMDARGLDERTDLGDASDSRPDDPLLEKRDLSSLALHDSQQGLVHLADETGGLALMNTNDLGAGLSRIHEDTSSYYSIGVTLSKLPSAGYQNVRVEVGRPGAVVRTRRGYAARSESERVRDRVQATLTTNLRYSGVSVAIRMGKPVRKGGRYTVPLSVTIPPSGLTFLPEGTNRRATADVYIAAMDEQGRMSEITREDATFALPAGREETIPLVHSATLLTRKGNHRIVVNVRDKVTGRMGTAKADVRVE